MKEETPHRGYLSAVLGCYCPRCREGKLFRHPVSIRVRRNMDMHQQCPVCGQQTDIEVGFYYGTGYVSYVIAIIFTVIFFAIWLFTIGFSFHDRRFLAWIIINSVILLLMQPWLMRFSRSLWLSWFVHYDPDWKGTPPEDPERIVREQMNNW